MCKVIITIFKEHSNCFYYKMNIRNDLQLSLKIAEYLLEPSILIIGHSYDKFNNFIYNYKN